jgi:citrate synthase
MQNDNQAIITFNQDGEEKIFKYNILKSSRGPCALDMRSFYTDTGLFTYDVGFTSTASCSSDITFIDGNKGELRYRGIEIKELALNHTYLETCYLLINGVLPNKEQLEDFDLELRHRSFLHEGLKQIFNAFPDNAHPMATLSAGVTSLASFYFDHLDIDNEEEYQEMACRLIAKIPTIAAFAYRHSIGISYIEPDINLSFTHNFLSMLRSYPHSRLRILVKLRLKL